MANYSSLEEVWGQPFPGNLNTKKSKKNKKNKQKNNNYLNYSLLEDETPVDTFEHFSNYNNEEVEKKNNIQIKYEDEIEEENIEELNKDKKENETTLLKNKVEELNEKINNLVDNLNKKNTEIKEKENKDNNKNLYDLVLFAIFGLLFLLLLESVTKLVV